MSIVSPKTGRLVDRSKLSHRLTPAGNKEAEGFNYYCPQSKQKYATPDRHATRCRYCSQYLSWYCVNCGALNHGRKRANNACPVCDQDRRMERDSRY